MNEPVEVTVHKYLLHRVIQNEFHNDVRVCELQEIPSYGVVNNEGNILVDEVCQLCPIHRLNEEVYQRN